MPFGEELGSGIGGRTTGMGFIIADGIRQKFTSYERDNETALDFAQARYYSSQQGRFTSVDPLMASASVADPQTFNRYTYAMNTPTNATDPSGMLSMDNTSAMGQYAKNFASGYWTDDPSGPFGGANIASGCAAELSMCLSQDNRSHAERVYESRLNNTFDALAATAAYERGGPNDSTYQAIMKRNKSLVAVSVFSQGQLALLDAITLVHGKAAGDIARFDAVANLTGLSAYIVSSNYDAAKGTFDVSFRNGVSEFLAQSPYFKGPGPAFLHLDIGPLDYRSDADLTGGLSLQVVPGRLRSRSYADFDKDNPYHDGRSFVKHNGPILMRRGMRLLRGVFN